MANHRGDASVLYHIDVDGTWNEITDYKAIGSGSTIAGKICGGLDHNKITMKDFIRRAYLASDLMDHYCPGLGVGVEPGGVPNIKYLYIDQEWDKEAARDMPEDIKEYREYTNNKLQKIKQSLESIVSD